MSKKQPQKLSSWTVNLGPEEWDVQLINRLDEKFLALQVVGVYGYRRIRNEQTGKFKLELDVQYAPFIASPEELVQIILQRYVCQYTDVDPLHLGGNYRVFWARQWENANYFIKRQETSSVLRRFKETHPNKIDLVHTCTTQCQVEDVAMASMARGIGFLNKKSIEKLEQRIGCVYDLSPEQSQKVKDKYGIVRDEEESNDEEEEEEEEDEPALPNQPVAPAVAEHPQQSSRRRHQAEPAAKKQQPQKRRRRRN